MLDKCYSVYKISSGDSIYSIAKTYGVNPILLMKLNGIDENDYIYPDQELLIPKKDYSYYISIEGDTLDIVSDKFNISKEELLGENTIYLLPGQLLFHKK
jgi:spore germination protein